MKKILFFFLAMACLGLKAQKNEIEEILSIAKRDSTDKACKFIFDDLYTSFESDEGFTNSKFGSAIENLMAVKEKSKASNEYLLLLLQQYTNDTSEPEKALQWIDVLKVEYPKVYGNIHPLILLYQGESLINIGKTKEAYQHFIDFQKKFPYSVMAMVYIHQTEKDKNLAKTWLSVLKCEHPNHWIVKNLK